MMLRLPELRGACADYFERQLQHSADHSCDACTTTCKHELYKCCLHLGSGQRRGIHRVHRYFGRRRPAYLGDRTSTGNTCTCSQKIDDAVTGDRVRPYVRNCRNCDHCRDRGCCGDFRHQSRDLSGHSASVGHGGNRHGRIGFGGCGCRKYHSGRRNSNYISDAKCM